MLGIGVLGIGVGVRVLRILVGRGVGGIDVFVGCGMSVLVGGMSVLVGGMSVLVGFGVEVLGGMDVFVGRGSGVAVRSSLWQSGSDLSASLSPSSSVALKQYSLPPVLGINKSSGTSQMTIESKRIVASGLSSDSTNKPTSPLV